MHTSRLKSSFLLKVFFLLFLFERERSRERWRVRQRQIRNLKNKSQRRRVYATDPSSAKRSIHAKQTSNRPFPSRLHYVYNYIEMMIIWTLFSLLRYKHFYYRLSAANFILGKTKTKKSETPSPALLLKQQQRERAIATANANSRGGRCSKKKETYFFLICGCRWMIFKGCVKVMRNSAVGGL